MDPILFVRFYRTETGREPVREWLRSLGRDDRRIIGEDIKSVQFGWPIGMPLVRKLDGNLWEVRSKLQRGIVRIVFTTGKGEMILLHAFFKKSQKTSRDDLELARNRFRLLYSR